jgi:hypothetical protein
MDKLKENWLTDGLIDFEYKKYVLLAYLQHVRESFNKVHLYPFLADLVFHYRNLMQIKDNKALLGASFPKELSPESLQKLEVSYRKIVEDDSLMQELEAIMEFALPQLKASLDEGSGIYEYVESNCEISPVGLTSLYAQEGYLLVSQPPQSEGDVYRYQVSIFEHETETSRGLHTHFVRSFTRTLAHSYEQVKLHLIREFKDLPNPAVYVIVSKLRFPYTQTLMPVAKRLLIKQLLKAA